MNNIIAFLSGAGAMLLVIALLFVDHPKRTCASAAAENKALEHCLKFRPTCEAVTTDDFIKYYDNKDWLAANCPVESGDGFLSQSSK